MSRWLLRKQGRRSEVGTRGSGNHQIAMLPPTLVLPTQYTQDWFGCAEICAGQPGPAAASGTSQRQHQVASNSNTRSPFRFTTATPISFRQACVGCKVLDAASRPGWHDTVTVAPANPATSLVCWSSKRTRSRQCARLPSSPRPNPSKPSIPWLTSPPRSRHLLLLPPPHLRMQQQTCRQASGTMSRPDAPATQSRALPGAAAEPFLTPTAACCIPSSCTHTQASLRLQAGPRAQSEINLPMRGIRPHA